MSERGETRQTCSRQCERDRDERFCPVGCKGNLLSGYAVSVVLKRRGGIPDRATSIVSHLVKFRLLKFEGHGYTGALCSLIDLAFHLAMLLHVPLPVSPGRYYQRKQNATASTGDGFFSPSVETRIGKKSTAFVVFPFSLFSFFLSFFFFLFFLFFLFFVPRQPAIIARLWRIVERNCHREIAFPTAVKSLQTTDRRLSARNAN